MGIYPYRSILCNHSFTNARSIALQPNRGGFGAAQAVTGSVTLLTESGFPSLAKAEVSPVVRGFPLD